AAAVKARSPSNYPMFWAFPIFSLTRFSGALTGKARRMMNFMVNLHYQHIQFVRLTSRKEAQMLINRLSAQPP
ncbi:hypothetical protein ACT3TX_14575, partial [Halomonas sp. AOP23-I1-17]